jgi:hypothetical protein
MRSGPQSNPLDENIYFGVPAGKSSAARNAKIISSKNETAIPIRIFAQSGMPVLFSDMY